MTFRLVPANQFKLEQLVAVYNQTRQDYMVPMPMSATRLEEYIRIYDIDLAQSLVAIDGDDLIGLGMLGIRGHRSWITRLGLRADNRSRGIGRAMVKGLLENSDQLTIPKNMLEVIKGNQAARRLFHKLGFRESRELLIMRRTAKQAPKPRMDCIPINEDEMQNLLEERKTRQAWTNQTESLSKLDKKSGFHVVKKNLQGWMIYQAKPNKISRLVFRTRRGDPVETTDHLLAQLHSRHPGLPAQIENIPANDQHLPALKKHGYVEVFRRIEMVRYA
ncbi:MAG TPA: hypothetical protein DCY42_00995 [Chloroflexi bacterium]|nr:hypothetical protein [Chloroflexota bacterium]